MGQRESLGWAAGGPGLLPCSAAGLIYDLGVSPWASVFSSLKWEMSHHGTADLSRCHVTATAPPAPSRPPATHSRQETPEL